MRMFDHVHRNIPDEGIGTVARFICQVSLCYLDRGECIGQCELVQLGTQLDQQEEQQPPNPRPSSERQRI